MTMFDAQSVTVADWLTDWLDSQADVMRPVTHEAVRVGLARHVIPVIGDRRLRDLTTRDLHLVVAFCREHGQSDRYAYATVKVLARAFRMPDPRKSAREIVPL